MYLNLNDIYEILSKEMDIPVEVVRSAYSHSWRFITEKIRELPLQEELTEEEFNKLKLNFNLPSLGKLHLNYRRWVNITNRNEFLRELKRRKDNEAEED